MSQFKYIGRVFNASENYWPVVISNFSKAWRKWDRMSRILGQEGSDARTTGIFYKSVVQATLLFRLETWVMASRIGWTLGGFYHRVAHRLEV